MEKQSRVDWNMDADMRRANDRLSSGQQHLRVWDPIAWGLRLWHRLWAWLKRL